VIALFFGLLFVHWMMKTTPIVNKVRSVMGEYAGDAVASQRIELSILSRPRLIVRMVGISFHGTVMGTVESI